MIQRFFACIVTVLLLLPFTNKVQAQQEPPFWKEIQAFKKQDSLHFPPSNAILFVGSSSFNYWKDVQDYFPGYTIINRGFGGSSLPHVITYANDIIFPYHPRQVVIYCGENDLNASDTVTAQVVFSRFSTLFNMIRKKLPKAPIVFVSIKPSPSRARLMPEMVKSNDLIKAFLAKQRNTAFVDVYHSMLNADGTPRKELFGPDMLHMNKQGYAIWQKAIQPHLLKD